jgi:glycosyltransferase involved in cell wall biosynthesis
MNPASSGPKVSCLMVTADRAALMSRAIRCFARQTYANRELVVIDDGKEDLRPVLAELPEEQVRYVKLEKRPEQTLGFLRNVSLEEARGEILIQWDDDDWYHADRIAKQITPILDGADASVLSGALMHLDTPEFFRHPYLGTLKNGVPGTIMHRKHATIRYPTIKRAEDSIYLDDWKKEGTIAKLPVDEAHLFIRCFHGRNTWEKEHFLTRMRNTPKDHLAYVWHAHIRRDLFGHPRFRIHPEGHRAVEQFVKDSFELKLFAFADSPR